MTCSTLPRDKTLYLVCLKVFRGWFLFVIFVIKVVTMSKSRTTKNLMNVYVKNYFMNMEIPAEDIHYQTHRPEIQLFKEMSYLKNANLKHDIKTVQRWTLTQIPSLLQIKTQTMVIIYKLIIYRLKRTINCLTKFLTQHRVAKKTPWKIFRGSIARNMISNRVV